ncbi:MAG: PRC-barrel domain-containing protein [Steroidobacteraceae bacterium]
MVYRIKQLDRCRICALDGEIGHVRDVYFDDEQWVIRYLVVETGNWLTGRKVLISPYGVARVDFDERTVAVNLTRRQVAHSPDIDTEKPVGRQLELEYLEYYGYPTYWPYTTLWPWGSMPAITPPATGTWQQVRARDVSTQTASRPPRHLPASRPQRHLRSANEVLRYHIRATDDSIGHAEDALFDPRSWSIRFLVVDTRNWWPGKRVLVAPAWIDNVDWPERSIAVAMTRDEIQRCPEYDPGHQPVAAAEQRRSDYPKPDQRH